MDLRALIDGLAVLREEQGALLLDSCTPSQIRKLNFILYTVIFENFNKTKYTGHADRFSNTFKFVCRSIENGGQSGSHQQLSEKSLRKLYRNNISAIKSSLFFIFFTEGFKALPKNVVRLEE